MRYAMHSLTQHLEIWIALHLLFLCSDFRHSFLVQRMRKKRCFLFVYVYTFLATYEEKKGTFQQEYAG